MREEKALEMVYRDYHQGDENQLVPLMSGHWSHIQNVEDWLHEYVESPDGPCVSRVCEANGQIVGHYGLILMQMTVAGQKILGGKGEGSIVDREFQREYVTQLRRLPPESRSIFERLSREVWTEGVSRGVGIMWGFPNQMALPGHLKAEWGTLLLNSVKLVRPLSSAGIARALARRISWKHGIAGYLARLAAIPLSLAINLMRPLKQPGNHEVVAVPHFDDRVDDCWQRIVERNPMISIDRTSRHLNWRFGHDSYVRVVCLSGDQVTGYAIGLLNETDGIVDFRLIDLVVEDSAFQSIPKILVGLVSATGAKTIDLISAECIEGCDYQQRLQAELKKSLLFSSEGSEVTAILKINPQMSDGDYLRNPKNWFISTLFHELF